MSAVSIYMLFMLEDFFERKGVIMENRYERAEFEVIDFKEEEIFTLTEASDPGGFGPLD